MSDLPGVGLSLPYTRGEIIGSHKDAQGDMVWELRARCWHCAFGTVSWTVKAATREEAIASSPYHRECPDCCH